MSQRVFARALSKELTSGGTGKPSVNSANSGDWTLETRVWNDDVFQHLEPSVQFPEVACAKDPKPGELPMSRVNVVERRREARTGEPYDTLG